MDVQSRTTRNAGPGLYEFLMEAELQHYYAGIKGDLKVQTAAQLKYVAEEDLNAIGMSKPEMRRLKKYFQKYFSQNYLSKFKKMLLPKKEEHFPGVLSIFSDEKQEKPSIKVPNKHMIPTDAIIVNKELGVGEFGIVQQGVWTNDGERIQVAIKCLSRERMQNNPIEFLKEAAIMHSIDHENIVRLYGVVLDTNSLMLVTELAPLRSLLECLKEPSLRASFPVLSLCDFTIQIANGMQYLEAKRLIHRDLAARNILVFSKNKVKISDFGLSRALGVGKDYYQTNFNVNLKLPIAWCAPECISYLKFTSASDVWAFGVTLWEMFSYGFQPWAALTGHQILEAIDEPNFQRLDEPDCCPKDYFSIMQQCWHHESGKRPKFSELTQLLPDLKPEQVQAVQDNSDIGQLTYHQGDIITVLDKGVNNVFWKGVLSNGKTGVFNPAHTITYLGSNLPSNKPSEFIRGDGKNAFSSQRRKIRMDMISSPQGDLKHTGHVGLDGAYFGDISFLGGKYPHIPRQIVTPYKPQEDANDQLIQYNKQESSNSDVFRDFSSSSSNIHSPHDVHQKPESLWIGTPSEISSSEIINEPNELPIVDGIEVTDSSADHEYHEISDEESQNNALRFDKPLDFDFGPSLLDEMDQMFRSLGASSSSLPPGRMTSADHESSNAKNEIREIQAKQGNKKKQATVKPISAADQRTLYSAIAMAQELTARSMTDLEYPAESPPTPTSPSRRRKFSFKLPHNSPKVDRRHFSEEAAGIPDIQATLSDEAKEVYNSLVETPIMDSPRETNPLRILRSGRHNSFIIENGSIRNNEDENPIPLPPRDRSKTLQPKSNLPRHQRKHPLIIPGNGISRTLAKMSTSSIGDQVDGHFFSLDESDPKTMAAKNNMTASRVDISNSPDEFELRIDLELSALDSLPMDNNRLTSDLLDFSDNTIKSGTKDNPVKKVLGEKINSLTSRARSEYAMHSHTSLDTMKNAGIMTPHKLEQQFNVDMSNLETLPDMHSSTVNSSQDKSLRPVKALSNNSGASISESEIDINMIPDIRQKPIAEEYPSNSLQISKITDRQMQINELSRHSDHVSCEDLLEFACDGPNIHRTRGPHNGKQSDEVRIMLKVLHGNSTPESCVAALDITDWDILTAIKLERLQDLLKKEEKFVSLEDCKVILNQCNGDIVKAATLLKNVDDTASV